VPLWNGLLAGQVACWWTRSLRSHWSVGMAMGWVWVGGKSHLHLWVKFYTLAWTLGRMENHTCEWNFTSAPVRFQMLVRIVNMDPKKPSAGPTLQPPMSFLGGDALQEAVEWNLRPRVSGGRAWWPVSQHQANYRLNQVGNCSCNSYKYPLQMELNIPHYTCSSPRINVPV
jgi:hypothetical protein